MQEPASDCDWMTLHFEALFVHDVLGRIRARREPDAAPPPRFILGRTPHGNLWRFRSDTPAELASGLSRLAAREAALSTAADPASPPERLAPLRGLLERQAPIEQEWRGPTFRFDLSVAGRRALCARGRGASPLVPGTAASRALAESFPLRAAAPERHAPCWALLEAGRVVCLCHAVGEQGGPAFEARVETLPSHRGRGLAPRCIAAWAIDVLEHGALPLYSAPWQNVPARAVARELRLVMYGEDLQLG